MFIVLIQATQGVAIGQWQLLAADLTREEAESLVADHKWLDAKPPRQKYHYRIKESVMTLGVADSKGTPIKIGDFVRRPAPFADGPHGEWCVSQVILQAGFPVLSYCYSQKGKVLPSGYSRGFLSDLYGSKSLLWINPGHFDMPEDDDGTEIIVLKLEEVDMDMVEQQELTPRKQR